MKKRKILITLIILLLLIIVFKIVMLLLCNTNKDSINIITKGLQNREEITITSKTLNEDEYFTHNSIKLKNIMDGYNLDEKAKEKYIKNNSDGTTSVIYFIDDNEQNMSLVEGFKTNSKDINFYGETDIRTNIFYLANRKKFLKDNNIKNDIDFYKFVGDNYPLKNSIFTSISKMMQNCSFNYYVEIVIPKIESMTIIKGDLDGYIFKIGTKNETSVYQITILDNNRKYGFTTNDPRFNDKDFIKDILGTIKIIK